MKNTLIVYCHPYSGSFNNAILESATAKLTARGAPFEIIDLCGDGFDPRYSGAELALFSRGETLDPLVVKYQEKLKNADKIIIIAPIWWGDMPATLKGFFDKVMKVNFAYKSGKMGLIGLLTHIKSATVITTSASPSWYIRLFVGGAIRGVLIGKTLKQIGIKKRKWIHLGNVLAKKPTAREKFLKNIAV